MSIAVLTSFLLLFAAQPVEKAALSELLVSVSGEQVVVGVTLQNGFDQRLLDRIESGLPSGIEYEFGLYKDRQWFDDKLDRTRLRVVAMYNAVTREYLVNFKQDGKLVESRTVNSVEQLEAAMTQIESLVAFTLDASSRRRRLLVRAQAVLGSKTVLSFIPAKIRTDTLESSKFRPAGAQP